MRKETPYWTRPVTFLSHYERNWESCSFRWVWAFRKNLPTEGTNDTQASESTFRAIKYYTKLEFGGKTPTMNQIIICLPKILDTRTECSCTMKPLLWPTLARISVVWRTMLSLRSITGKRITRESTPQMALSVTVPGSRVSSSVGIFFSLECRLNNRYLKKICFTQV